MSQFRLYLLIPFAFKTGSELQCSRMQTAIDHHTFISTHVKPVSEMSAASVGLSNLLFHGRCQTPLSLINPLTVGRSRLSRPFRMLVFSGTLVKGRIS